MYILEYKFQQAIEIIVAALECIEERELARLNQEVFINTAHALPTGINKDLVIKTFLEERDKYYLKEGIKLPSSTAPNKEYYVALCTEEDVGDDPMFHVVDKDFYHNEGCIDDRHIMDILLSNLDNSAIFEDEISEVAESLFESMKMNRTETLEFLKGIPNFTYNPAILGN